MDVIFTVLQIVAPVFLLAALGFSWVKMGYEYSTEFITRLSMTISVPCLIFVSLMKTDIPQENLLNLVLASIVAYAVITILFLMLVLVSGLDRRTFLHPLVFGNTGNLGLPLAFFAFGSTGLSSAVVVFAIMAVYSFSLGIWMVSDGLGVSKLVKEPVTWGTVLGAVFMINDWQTPIWMTNTLDLAGQMAIPLMLITLGVALARIKPNNLARSFGLSIIKVIACTAIAAGAGVYFQLDKIAFAVLVLQIATPVAVTSYLLAAKYGADSDEVAGLVVVSTFISILAIPLTLAFLI
jgi:predicted permease